MAAKQRIEVSREMLSFVGPGTIASDWPADWTVMLFGASEGGAAMTVADAPDPAALATAPLVLVVDPAALLRLFGFVPAPDQWHLPGELRAIVQAIDECGVEEPARATLRLAKSIELLCTAMTRLDAGALVPAGCAGALSAGDAARIRAARALIDERWREKLTLDGIARACGVNRAKLTRGFRLLFSCSIADALAENRLGGARRMLHETDLPVSSIGYACGYHSNASFARAFARRYGMAPTQLRQRAAA